MAIENKDEAPKKLEPVSTGGEEKEKLKDSIKKDKLKLIVYSELLKPKF